MGQGTEGVFTPNVSQVGVIGDFIRAYDGLPAYEETSPHPIGKIDSRIADIREAIVNESFINHKQVEYRRIFLYPLIQQLLELVKYVCKTIDFISIHESQIASAFIDHIGSLYPSIAMDSLIEWDKSSAAYLQIAAGFLQIETLLVSLSNIGSLAYPNGNNPLWEKFFNKPEKQQSQITVDTHNFPVPAELSSIYEWILLLLNPENWKGTPFPYYVEINQADLKMLRPRPKLVTALTQSDLTLFALSQFGGSRYFPSRPKGHLVAQIWDDQSVSYSKREKKSWWLNKLVFEELVQESIGQAPSKNHQHADLCCGPGHIIEFMTEGCANVKVVGFDISTEMIEVARKIGLEAYEADLTTGQGIPYNMTSGYFKSATISFAEQWLEPQAYQVINKMLTEGGSLVFNIHRPGKNWEEIYPKMLTTAGFSQVTCYSKHLSLDGNMAKNLTGGGTTAEVCFVKAIK